MNSNFSVDVVSILPETLPSGKKILWQELDDGRILISVDKHSARGGNAKSIVIKRNIKICDDLFELFGLRFGDGIKLQGGKFIVFGFSNTNIELHKEFLRLSEELFGLDNKDFRARVSVPVKLENSIEEIENRFSIELKIPIENFFNPQVLERRNLPFLDIKISSTILGLVINLLVIKLNDFLFLNKKFVSNFLKGIIASDSNISVRNNKLAEINIAAHDKEERKFIRKLLMILGIQPNKDKETEHDEAVLVHGLSNFNLFKEWNLVSLHQQKLEAFNRGLRGFKLIEFRKGEGQIKILKILENGKLRREEIQKLINRGFRTTLLHGLVPLESKDLVRRIRKSRNIFWEITEKGRFVLTNDNPVKFLKEI